MQTPCKGKRPEIRRRSRRVGDCRPQLLRFARGRAEHRENAGITSQRRRCVQQIELGQAFLIGNHVLTDTAKRAGLLELDLELLDFFGHVSGFTRQGSAVDFRSVVGAVGIREQSNTRGKIRDVFTIENASAFLFRRCWPASTSPRSRGFSAPHPIRASF